MNMGLDAVEQEWIQLGRFSGCNRKFWLGIWDECTGGGKVVPKKWMVGMRKLAANESEAAFGRVVPNYRGAHR